jgi:hypothetical protein
MKLGDYLNAINKTKEPLFESEDESVAKDYVPFIINRCLSYHMDSILFVNMLNEFPEIDKDQHFDFLRSSLRPKSRYSKWEKPNITEDLKVVQEYYNYSYSKAYDALSVLSESDIDEIRKKVDKGGLRK